MAEPSPRPGEPLYFAEGLTVRKSPLESLADDGSTHITLGLPVATVSEYLDETGAQAVATLLCRGEAFETLVDALLAAIRVAGEAAEEWDKAPEGMRAGKLLIALSGRAPGYRADIDAIHAALKAAIDG